MDAMVVFPDNCQVCGDEKFSYELMPIKLGSHSFANIKTCMDCLVNLDSDHEYQESAQLLAEILEKNSK